MAQTAAVYGGILLALRADMPLEILIGRSVAFCVHPRAAWHRLNNTGRALLVTAYGGASYVLVFVALLML